MTTFESFLLRMKFTIGLVLEDRVLSIAGFKPFGYRLLGLHKITVGKIASIDT